MITIGEIYQVRPLWKKQVEGDSNLYLNLFFGLIGMNHAFFSLLLFFLSSFSARLLNALGSSSTGFITSGSNFLLSNLIVLGFDLIFAVVLLYSSSYFRSSDILIEWENLREETLNSLDKGSEKRSLVIYILSTLALGYIAGLVITAIYIIPYFLLFITLNFLLLFITPFSARLVIDIFLCWIILMYFIVKSKLDFKVAEEIRPDFKQDFTFSNRTYEILASGEQPIICNGCKSYISAKSKHCQVCGERINP